MILQVLKDLTKAINENAQAVRQLTEYLRKSNMTVTAFLIDHMNAKPAFLGRTKITVDEPKQQPKPESRKRYIYTATCVEDGVVTEADNRKELADAIGLSDGGTLTKKFNTGNVIKSRKTGHKYILLKKEITNE